MWKELGIAYVGIAPFKFSDEYTLVTKPWLPQAASPYQVEDLPHLVLAEPEEATESV